MTPVAPFLDKMGLFEDALLQGGKYRQHLIHMLQVYLLGALIISSSTNLSVFIDRAFGSYQFSAAGKGAIPLDVKASVARVLDVWMVVSCCHDVAYPIQKFKDWLRLFFENYVEPSVVRNMPLGVINSLSILQNRRFHEYKQRLVARHPECARWLDKMYYSRLAEHSPHAPDHGILSGFLVMDALDRLVSQPYEPGNRFVDDFIRLIRHLFEVDKPTYESIRDLIGDAMALHGSYWWRSADDQTSDRSWYRDNSELMWDQLLFRQYESEGATFSIQFAAHPLAFLLAFCDVLQEYGRPRVGTDGEPDIYNPSLYVHDVQVLKQSEFIVVMRHSSRTQTTVHGEELSPIASDQLRHALRLLSRASIKESRRRNRAIRVRQSDRANGVASVNLDLVGIEHDSKEDVWYVADYLYDIADKIRELRLFSSTFRCGKDFRFGVRFDGVAVSEAAPLPETWWIDGEDACWREYEDVTRLIGDCRVWDDTYRRARGRIWSEAPVLPLERFLRFVKRQGARSVLDAGCGDGRYVKLMMQLDYPRIVGCDASEAGLKLCRDYVKSNFQEKRDSFTPITATLESRAYLAGDFDIALCNDVLMHTEYEVSVEILRNLHRAVRPEGWLVFNLCTVDEPTRKARVDIGEVISEVDHYTAWYIPPNQNEKFYFTYYDEKRLRKLLDDAFDVATIGRAKIRKWRVREDPHPGYREYIHEHEFWLVFCKIPRPVRAHSDESSSDRIPVSGSDRREIFTHASKLVGRLRM